MLPRGSGFRFLLRYSTTPTTATAAQMEPRAIPAFAPTDKPAPLAGLDDSSKPAVALVVLPLVVLLPLVVEVDVDVGEADAASVFSEPELDSVAVSAFAVLAAAAADDTCCKLDSVGLSMMINTYI